jgi:glycosyltransferase involved in cell wall biosynthesis
MGVLAMNQPKAGATVATPAATGEVWSLSVVIPAYNEERGIAAIVERVLSVKPSLQAFGVSETELIVVDDGSRDRTAEVVAGYPSVRLVRHATNHGYGAALKTGFNAARGNLLAFLDADGTYPPEYLPNLCRSIMSGADLAIGSRMAGEESEMPPMRRIGNVFFAGMLSLVGNQRVSDSASGMRVFRRDALERLYPLPDGLNFTPVMSTRAIHENLKMVEVPVPYSERVGRSKLSVVRDGWRFLNSIVWTAMSYNPVRILGAIGAAGVILAALVVGVLAVLRVGGVAELPSWGIFAVYTGLLAGVVGVCLFSLGAMFNYLVSLFQKRPIRQGLFGKPIFNPPLDRQFWWMGGLAILVGLAVAIVSLIMSFNGWGIERLWLWLLGAAMVTVIGVQLLISWVLMRVLEEISQRELKTGLDMQGKG